jgi:transposase
LCGSPDKPTSRDVAAPQVSVAHHYAKGVGLRGKTDRVDAELLARMIAHEHTQLHAWSPPTPEQREIDRLLKRRAKLSSLRQALAMSLNGLEEFGADLKTLKARFDQVIARIDQRVKTLVEASPDRKQHVTHLRTIDGVGLVVSAALVNSLSTRGKRFSHAASFALASLFRLTPCSAASIAKARCTSGGMRTRNSPL